MFIMVEYLIYYNNVSQTITYLSKHTEVILKLWIVREHFPFTSSANFPKLNSLKISNFLKIMYKHLLP